METLTSTASIAKEIQFAIAPVFLLTAIAGMLTVLTGRLVRAVSLARDEPSDALGDSVQVSRASREDTYKFLHRIRLIEWAIRFNVVSALFICLVVVALFIGDYVEPNLSTLISMLFILAMMSMITGLLLFLQEVRLAAQQTRKDVDAFLEAKRDGILRQSSE